jgi:hypothetical protein
MTDTTLWEMAEASIPADVREAAKRWDMEQTLLAIYRSGFVEGWRAKRHEDRKSMFDDKENLWIEIVDRKVPPHLLVEASQMFMIEHNSPGRVMVNLTAYVSMLMDKRRAS